MEGDFIKINEWLLPLSWVYGLGVRLRNWLFDMGVLKTRSFDIPVISVGNITVGGSGKTPHVEHLIRILRPHVSVAVLSRGYKRKSSGYVLGTPDTDMRTMGDEPYQMMQKFPDIHMAVDRDRCHGIDRLTHDAATEDTDVVLLDDAYQHRYVKPGINILLTDYHRLITYDRLLPAGRLREPRAGQRRADIVIVTKCPADLKPMEYRVISKTLSLFPYQKLFFTTLKYLPLKRLFDARGSAERPLESLTPESHVLLITGIASPRQMMEDLQRHTPHITSLAFRDHHQFRPSDIERINDAFTALSATADRLIITTEKDSVRLATMEGLSPEVRSHLWVLPISVEFMLNQEENFNENIIGYVRKNSRNSILAKAKDDHKSHHSDHSGHRSRTISFRNNR